MNTQEEKKIQREVIQKVASWLLFDEIDFETLTPQEKKIAIIAFQAGIAYWNEKIKEENIKD